MRLKPNVTLSREEPFRSSCCVKPRPQKVQECHKKQPMEGIVFKKRADSVCDHVVDGWNDSTTSHPNKDSCSDRSEPRLAELVPKGDHDGTNTKHAHHCNVRDFWLTSAIEPVIDPWNEGAYYQKGDSHVVQLAENLHNPDAVTRKRVESERKSKT